jgi:hypothetical protein
MIVFYGSRMYGSVDQCGGTKIGTRFFHIYWMPLIPLGSHLILQEHGDGQFRSIPGGLNLRSVFAAYARSWGVIGAIGVLIAGISALCEYDDLAHLEGALMLVAGLVALALSVLAWVYVGKLSREQRAQRFAYAEHAGYPVDVAELREARAGLRHSLYLAVVERARGLMASGYRLAHNPETHWGAIALDPTVNDPQFLGAALTLTRLEWSFATGAVRAQLAQAHAAIWQKLRGCNPALLQMAQQAA